MSDLPLPLYQNESRPKGSSAKRILQIRISELNIAWLLRLEAMARDVLHKAFPEFAGMSLKRIFGCISESIRSHRANRAMGGNEALLANPMLLRGITQVRLADNLQPQVFMHLNDPTLNFKRPRRK